MLMVKKIGLTYIYNTVFRNNNYTVLHEYTINYNTVYSVETLTENFASYTITGNSKYISHNMLKHYDIKHSSKTSMVIHRYCRMKKRTVREAVRVSLC